MQGVVDADTHIAEPEAMWQLIDEKMAPRRPVLVELPEDTWFGDRNALWLIDGQIFPKPAGKGSYRLVTPSAQKAERHWPSVMQVEPGPTLGRQRPIASQ